MIMLAPMAELSYRALRELIEEFIGGCTIPPGPPLYYTEMISAPALLSGGPFEKWYLDSGPCPERLVYQLTGADHDQLVKAAALLDRRDCLGIDINMGCSAPAITKTGAGVRWMESPGKAARLVEALRRVTGKRLSVKIRLGPKDRGNRAEPDRARYGQPETPGQPDDEPPGSAEKPGSGIALPGFSALLTFCRRLEEAGLDFIALHPRNGSEKFKRRARWEYVDALRKELSIPVAGNGDIASAEELARKAEAGPVMAGRLLVREPWACAEAAGTAGPCTDPQGRFKETALRFLELVARHQPPEFHLSRARRFFHYYCDNVTWAEWLRNRINRETSLKGMGSQILRYADGSESFGKSARLFA